MTIPNSPPRRGRPPKVPRTHHDTREALLHVGMAVFTEQGFSATGIDAVLKQVQVPKGSFYHYFASKEAFGQEVLQGYAAYFAKSSICGFWRKMSLRSSGCGISSRTPRRA
jgi:TetR/AcrR family transcriptional repressor of nem operon